MSNVSSSNNNSGKSVTTDTLVKICDALHCKIDDIMEVVNGTPSTME